MQSASPDIIQRLQQELLVLQGIKSPRPGGQLSDGGLHQLRHAFPNRQFPIGAVHEFSCDNRESLAATSGFVSGIGGNLMKTGGMLLWITSRQLPFAPALCQFGIIPHHVLFVRLHKDRDILWTMEEALHCEALAGVVAETGQLDFTAARRLQLAVEKSCVTGFVLRTKPGSTATGCVTRWKITPVASNNNTGLPGVGYPCWNVELLKVRNGKPGSWQMQWKAGAFELMTADAPATLRVHRKTG